MTAAVTPGREELAAELYAVEYSVDDYPFANAPHAERDLFLKMADIAIFRLAAKSVDEGVREALEAWHKAEQARHDASAIYNARLETIRAERERGSWSMSIYPEYAALGDSEKIEAAKRRELFAALSTTGEPKR